jgi:hypothetical protein
MKNKIFIIIAIIFIAMVAVFSLRFLLGGPEDDWICVNNEWIKHGNPSAPMPETGCGPEIKNFSDCAKAGYPIMESYPRQCRDGSGSLLVEDIGNEFQKSDLIQINKPRPNEVVTSPLAIEGQARGTWFFEASFPVKLLDNNGQVMATAIAQAQSDWMTEDFVPYKATIEFTAKEGGVGTLVLEKDNPSDLPQNADELRVPVIFGQGETIKVKVFFNNDKLDPEISCNKVFPVEREIPKTLAAARAALLELLKGPTEKEKNNSYSTSIPSKEQIIQYRALAQENGGSAPYEGDEIKVNSLKIVDGTAYVDFSLEMNAYGGGSCRVSAIRAQISQTLKQFPTIKEVVISVDQDIEGALQP